MGLIREPKNVDFTFLDKPWTEEEKKSLAHLSGFANCNEEKLLLNLKKMCHSLICFL